MSTWTKQKLGSIGRVVTGKTPPTVNQEYFGIDYPFITPSDIPDYKVRKANYIERYLSQKWRSKAKNYLLPPKTICYVCIGSTVGKTCMTDRESFSNQQINSIICDKKIVQPDYVFYLLKNRTKGIKAIADASGVGKGIINKTSFENLDLTFPDIPTQTRIASILSTYDELIENNEKRIKILEEMAERLYNECFVKFKFPGHEKVKMIDSGTEYGKVPERWEVKRLDSEIELAYGKALKEGDRKSGDILVCGSGGVVDTHHVKLVDGPGIVVGRKGNAGVVSWIESDFWVIDTAYFVKTKLSLVFVYYLLKTQNFVLGDAAVPGLNREQAYRNLILIPPSDLISAFTQKAEPLRNLISKINIQNRILSKTRDLLIPQLVTGRRKLF